MPPHVKTIVPYAAPLSVNAPTPLLAWTLIPADVDTMLVAMTNMEGSLSDAQFVVETSEDGQHADIDRIYQYQCPAGKQCSIELGPKRARSYFRITVTPVAGALLVTWQVTGLPRVANS